MPEIASILDSTKDSLGVLPSVTAFDAQIIMHINATLGNIAQLGVGPEDGFRISDNTKTWADLLGINEARYGAAKDYMFLSVKLLFDPPQLLSVLNAFKELREEAAYRLNRAREDLMHPFVGRAGEDNTSSSEITDGSDLDGAAMRMRARAGIPFARNVRITNGKNIWTNLDDFEARMQIRTSKDSKSDLVYDFTPHLTKVFDDNDIVLSWSLTGEQTRSLKPGYFDLVVSDAGSTDARAIRVIYGYLGLDSLITT